MNKQFNDAIGILRKADEEQRNWDSARTKLGELLAAAIEAGKNLAEFDKLKAAKQAQLSELDGQIARRQQEVQKFASEAESVKPDSKQLQALAAREKAVMAREEKVLGREEAILVREQKAKDLADRLASFHDLNS
jgi:hypothetical protein